MDAKDSVFVFVLLLLSLGLFGSLSLTYCVWNKQTEVTSELQNELHKMQNKLQIMKSREHLGSSKPSQVKGQLKRSVQQADNNTDTLSAIEIALTEIKEMKHILMSYMNCDKNEYNHTKCTLKPGLKGEPGPEGPTGEKGTKGEPGDTGPPGTQGVAGQKGPVGPKGDTGLPGQEGPTGEKGIKGEPGDMGPRGDKGMKGNVGYPGYKGEKGVAGSPGAGLKGKQGVAGPKGDAGPAGERGEKGDMGERGLKGDMGPPGLQGETGERGDMGQKGEPGVKGIKGNQGDKGEKGEQGLGVGVPCGGPGWRRVVFFNMTNTSHDCPTGLNLTTYSRRTCGRALSGWESCSSTTFSVGGSKYSRVCGRALAYRWGFYNFAFGVYHVLRIGIEGSYVDGLSLTHGGPGSRQHIWSFASGWFTGDRNSNNSAFRCPCDNGNIYPPPPFVGNDYFCESALNESTYERYSHSNATLWDGQVCEGGGTCCQLNNPPWFTKNLASYTTDDIELRLCMYWFSSFLADIALELLELYVQ